MGKPDIEKQQKVLSWMRANPGEHVLQDILKGAGYPHDSQACSANAGVLTALAKKGEIAGRKTGSRSRVWSFSPGGTGTVAQNAVAAIPDPVLVTDPWGDEVTEKDAQGVIKNALAYYFDHLMDSKARGSKKKAKRELFIAGAFMTGRPLPVPVAPVINQISQAAPIAEPEAEPMMPADLDYRGFAKLATAALKAGRLNVKDVAEIVNIGSQYVDKVLRGKQEPTRDMLSKIWAACGDSI